MDTCPYSSIRTLDLKETDLAQLGNDVPGRNRFLIRTPSLFAKDGVRILATKNGLNTLFTGVLYLDLLSSNDLRRASSPLRLEND
jgi:hypothetical protein